MVKRFSEARNSALNQCSTILIRAFHSPPSRGLLLVLVPLFINNLSGRSARTEEGVAPLVSVGEEQKGNQEQKEDRPLYSWGTTTPIHELFTSPQWTTQGF